MKILIITNNSGGLYKFRKEIIESMINANHEVHITLPDREYMKNLTDMGCIYHRIEFERRKINIINELKLISKYNKTVKNIQPDIIFTYTIKPNIYGAVAAKINRIPYIMNITGLGSTFQKKSILSMIITSMYKIAGEKARRIFFQNRTNMELFLNAKIVNENQAKLIPGSGVNLSFHTFEDYPADDGTLRFLFIGRLMKDKGVAELIEAAKRIKSKYDNTEFNLIGFCEEEFTEEFNRLNKDNTVIWHGQQDDVHAFIKTHHATILPSYHEGMANVLLESASSGRPVLASKIPGCAETFDEEVSGFGFDVKSVDSLEKTIVKFIGLPYEQKKAMGIAGRKKVEREFDRNIIIDAYMNEIDKIQKQVN